MEEPGLYSTVNNPQRHAVSVFSDEFVDEIGKMSGRCLDVGSGPGDTFVDFILPKLNTKAELVCSDISEEMMSFAKKKYKDNKRLSFIKLNIESPDLPKDLVEQFNHVISTYCLHWCHDIRQAFKNIFDLLQPGGTAFITFLSNFPGIDAYREMAMEPRWQPYMKDVETYTPVYQHSDQPQKTLKALVGDVGFEVHHCSIRDRTHIFETTDVFRNFMVATNPFVTRIPADLRQEYEQDLFDAAVKKSVIHKKDNNSKEGDSVLIIYHSFLLHLKKPLAK